jgi:glycosyltransferase involved in cell wall biosynthesis/SAM-dependent methyltransferase
MNILIIAACEFASNTAIHPLNVARFMQSRGVECIVSFRSDDNNVRPKGPWKFQICDNAETAHNGVLFPDGRGPDLVHAWTPREPVRRLTERLVDRYGCPYIVHLEDNEEVILADAVPNLDCTALAALPARISELFIPPHLSHPKRYRWFLEGASGVTALIDRLMEFKPPGAPGLVFWPGFDEGILAAAADRAAFHLEEDQPILVYNGNIHPSNEKEVSNLIDGVGILRQRGIPVTLLKTGANHAALQKLKQAEQRGFLIDLGFVARSQIQSLLNIANVLVQPGQPSPFNDYRFPCKLPEFLAAGKPVVLPASNLGRFLNDGVECLLMQTGDPEEIADKVQCLLEDPELAERIGKAGREFAAGKLNWETNLEPVLELYRRLTEHPVVPRPVQRPDPLPVAIEKVSANGKSTGTYLEQAVQSIAVGDTRVAQRAGADPWLYQKWLAAAVEHGMRHKQQSIQVEGWIEQDAWLEATHRGYAAGLGNYLRDAGLPISDLALERALLDEPRPEHRPPKSAKLISDEQLRQLIEIHSGSYPAQQIGYATVRDYSDSADSMRALTMLQQDLTGVQRPWTVKAILGKVPRGSRLLEIGAGEPWVADILSRAGYEVWGADPYDFPCNGLPEMLRFMRECPAVRFIRNAFSDDLMDIPPASFDCVYSVSLLDKLEEQAVLAALRGIARFLKPTGVSIHALDFVQRGMGSREDLKRLELLASHFGLDDVELRSTLHQMDRDLDLFTLSAESLNRMRGSRPYDEFPMRKWASVHFVTSARNVTRNLPAAGRP